MYLLVGTAAGTYTICNIVSKKRKKIGWNNRTEKYILQFYFIRPTVLNHPVRRVPGRLQTYRNGKVLVLNTICRYSPSKTLPRTSARIACRRVVPLRTHIPLLYRYYIIISCCCICFSEKRAVSRCSHVMHIRTYYTGEQTYISHSKKRKIE